MIDRILAPKDSEYDFAKHNIISKYDTREWGWWEITWSSIAASLDLDA